MHDTPEVPEVYLDSLMGAVLPPLPLREFELTCNTLVTARHIIFPDKKNPRWSCLPQDPCASGQPEDKTFSFLEDITHAIENSHAPESHEWVALRITGQVVPVSFRHNTSHPDGFMYVRDVIPAAVEWADIVMPVEFKNKYEGKKKLDDFGKVMWSMHHIMRTDARRRYVYGLTCENTKARLWYSDRSDIVVSEEFDVNTDWKCLVRLILSILLAPPAELGYDTSIVANPSNDGTSEPSYDITIYNSNTEATSEYRTIRVLSDVGADSSVGRGTRVWAVQKLVAGAPFGPLYALKDVWVHESRLPEHQVINKIRRDQKAYAQYFLTPLDHGYVPRDLAEPSIPDNTHKTLRRQKLKQTGRALRTHTLPLLRTMGSKSQSTPGTPRDSVGHFEDIPNSSREGHRGLAHLSKDPRQHYRIVFEEIGEPVHKLRNFTDVFTAIQGGWEGLHAIHLSLQVHRDVSSGNILLVPASETLGQRGVIMDLEYAKEINDTSAPRDGRTGTAAFMATEVANMDHHRLRSVRSSRKRPNTKEELEQRTRARMEKTLHPNQVPLPTFRHNPLHDMESIWWLCIWVMLYLVPSNRRSVKYLENYQKVFSDPSAKRTFLCSDGVFGNLTTHLLETASLVPPMESWLEQLNDLYSYCYETQDASSTPLTRIRIDDEAIKLSYDSGKQFLEDLKHASRSISAEFVTLSERYHELSQTAPSTTRPSRDAFDGVHLPLPQRRRSETTAASK